MQTTEDINNEVHQRTMEFRAAFGNKEFFEEGMIRSLEAMFGLCEIFFGKDCASLGFDTMVSHVFQRNDGKLGWQEILEEDFVGIYSETKLGQLLHDLTAFADYGIVLATARDDKQRLQLLASQVQQAEALLSLLPSDVWGLNDEHLVVVLQKSLARWKVDNGDPLDAGELAILSGRALQTIKNKLSGQTKEIKGSQKRIEAHEARAWLSAQKDYYGSLWQIQDDTDIVIEADQGMGDVVFVPIAKDGSTFNPGLQRDGKYLIDAEGAEREFDDFTSALTALQQMHFPQWRRPTPEGKWTRVRGVEWRRVSVQELEASTMPQD